MSNLVHNERLKLAAAFANNLGVAAATAGAVVPLFMGPATLLSLFYLVGGVLFGVFCLLAALQLLGELRE
jgi:hypothetical protein